LFAARSAAVDSDAAGAAVAAGVAGVTANSGRVSALAVAGGTTWGVDSRTADGAGLTAGVPRISATRVHAAMAVSNPARGIPNRILFVITEIMVGTPYFMLPLEIQPGSTTGGAVWSPYTGTLPALSNSGWTARAIFSTAAFGESKSVADIP
jgi:hypothetical protein